MKSTKPTKPLGQIYITFIRFEGVCSPFGAYRDEEDANRAVREMRLKMTDEVEVGIWGLTLR